MDPLIGTQNFTPAEYQRAEVGGPVPAEYRANAQRTLEALQQVRDVLGVPVVVTGGYRSAPHNHDVGGVPDSQHLTASAADFVVPSLGLREVARRLDAADDRLTYHQLIYYLTDAHYHLGIGTDKERLVKVSPSQYAVYAGADTLPDRPAAAALEQRTDLAVLLLLVAITVGALLIRGSA